MKKLLVLCGAVLALAPASKCFAGLDTTWNDCVLESTVQDINYTNCNVALKIIKMYSCFKTPVPVPNFVDADLVYDLQEENVATLDKFWRFDDASAGGCNASGISIAINADFNGFCGSETNPWGAGGTSAQALLLGFSNGTGGPNRGRQFASIFRASNDPQPLDPLT